MKKIVIAVLVLLVLGLFALAQGGSAACRYDGVESTFTGSTRPNPHAPPLVECQYSHQYWDNDHWARHSFWQPCGS